MELLSSLRQLWLEWDLRMMLLLSLTLQIILIILGNRRKYSHSVWIKFFLWTAYLVADTIATYALGTLSYNLANIQKNLASWDANTELNAFWAPFLLLHLGGPDTITAYSLEDNELWLRHLLGLAFQTAAAAHVLLMAWMGSRLSILSVLVFTAGFIKYGERTWVLRSASSENRKSSFPIDPSSSNNQNYSSDEDELILAYKLLKRSKCFFSDDKFSEEVRKAIKIDYRNLCFQKAFKVIEIELGWVYDLLYTKAPLLYTLLGLGLRLISIILTCFVLVFLSPFLYQNKHKYSKVDLSITFLLLTVAIVLETYSILSLLFSDQFAVWLSMHNKTSTLKALTSFPLYRSVRWSNNISQLSLITFISKPFPCQKIFKLLSIDEKLLYMSYEEINVSLKKLVFEYLIDKARPGLALSSITPYRNIDDFVKAVITCHIETEISYHIDKEYIKEHNYNDILEYCESAKQISRYMFYLVLEHPSMFVSEGKLTPNVQLITDEAMNVLSLSLDQEQLEGGGQEMVDFNTALDVLSGKQRDIASKEKEVCNKLVHRILWQMPDYVPKQASAYEVLHKACETVSKETSEFVLRPQNDDDREEHLRWKWKGIISELLEDVVIKAAISSKGMEHAQQLRFGGEFLTHVWFLMLHLGFHPRYEYIQNQEYFQNREYWGDE